MRKFTMLLLILICLSFNMISVKPVFAATLFKEGVYKAADFNFTPNDRYTIKNTSPDSSVYVLLFDENRLSIQSIRLEPNSETYSLLPLEPDYRIVIIGKGEVTIA